MNLNYPRTCTDFAANNSTTVNSLYLEFRGFKVSVDPEKLSLVRYLQVVMVWIHRILYFSIAIPVNGFRLIHSLPLLLVNSGGKLLKACQQ
jgi:hypothetical protein